MEPEKYPGGRIVRRRRAPTTLRGSDAWTVALLAMSALALIVLVLVLSGHLLGR